MSGLDYWKGIQRECIGASYGNESLVYESGGSTPVTYGMFNFKIRNTRFVVHRIHYRIIIVATNSQNM